MVYKVEFLKLNSISNNYKFNLNSNFGISTLKESITSVGILYPLVVWKNNNSMMLVDGFKRFEIAKTTDLTELPFIFLPSGFNYLDIIKIRYYTLKKEDKELNAYQKLSILRLLEDADAEKSILNDWQHILNISNPEKFRKILYWPKIAKDYIYDYNVSIKQLMPLLNQTNQEIEEIFLFAYSLSIRIVELATIIEMISEIALNDNISFLSVLKQERFLSIIQDVNLNRNQKVLKLKKMLYEWRFPTITTYQKQMADMLKILSFNENISISYDKSFEKSELILSTRFRNIEDLNSFSNLITDVSNINVLKNILSRL